MRDLIIERLLIRAYSGIGKHADPVELTNLVPGLNLLWGANRRGKSCTARAITALLWGDASQATSASAEVTIRLGDTVSDHHYNAGSHDTIVEVPPKTFAPLYRLSLQDLLAQRDGTIAAKLREELYGNIDLNDAARRLGFELSFPKRCGATTQLREARAKLGDVTRSHQALREKADNLAGRERQLKLLSSQINAASHLDLLRQLLAAE
ncbi:MAG TPA: hypothetical protein DCR55_15755, partial [Lentisphaeria bacterium]|nr:hypothetical protein [Lentisphaeria bacterium]